MQLLSTQFTHDGRTLKQLSRSDKAAIYELRGWQGLLYGYEVIRVRVQKEREQFGKIFAEREVYPAASQFGYIAWSYGSRHKKEALDRYDRCAQREHQNLNANGPSELRRHQGGEQPYAVE